MSYDQVNQINQVLGLPVLLAWGLMVVAPRWRVTRVFLHSDVVPLVIAVVYAALVLPHVGGLFSSFRDLGAIAAAFQNPGFMLAGWIHYLAFDLLVGRVVLADSQRRGIPHL